MRQCCLKSLLLAIAVGFTFTIDSSAQCSTLPAPTITVSSTQVCAGQDAVITVQVQSPNNFYELYRGDELVAGGSDDVFLLEVTEPGPYKVRYAKSNNLDCYSTFSNE